MLTIYSIFLIASLLLLGPLCRFWPKIVNNYVIVLVYIASSMIFLSLLFLFSDIILSVEVVYLHFLFLIALILSSPVFFVKSPTLDFFIKFKPADTISEEELLVYFDTTKINDELNELKSAGIISKRGNSITLFGCFIKFFLSFFRFRKPL